MREINRNDARLAVDVYCYNCKKLCAMSNTYELNGRRYCYTCLDNLRLEDIIC